MNILHLESGRNFGGQELRTIMEVKALIARGHRVEMVVRPSTPTFRRAMEEQIPVHCLPLRTALDLVSISWLVWKIQKEKIDVLHAHSIMDAWIGGIAARLAPRRPAFIRTRHITNPIKHAYAYSTLPDALHVLTESRRQQFIRDHGVKPERIFVFRPAVDVSRFNNLPDKKAIRGELGVSSTAWTWINIAQFRNEKDHVSLVRAFAEFLETVPDSQLLLLGDDKDHNEERIRQLVQQLGVADKVWFLGFRKDVERILSAADVFVLSSLVEPFGKVVLEAFAAGIPVVATRAEGPLEIIRHGENGLFAELRDPHSITEQVLRYYREPLLARSCAEQARDWLPQVDFDASIQKLVAHYEIMAKRHRRTCFD